MNDYQPVQLPPRRQGLTRYSVLNWLLTLICILSIYPVSIWCAEGPDLRTMQSAPLVFSIPQAERIVLRNGITVYLLQDHELPLVTVTAMIRGGSLDDPKDKKGLAALFGSQLRLGGSGDKKTDSLDAELEAMASTVTSSFGASRGTVTLTCLSWNLEQTFRMFSDILFKPLFEPESFKKAQQRAIAAQKADRSDLKRRADRELYRALYRNQPLGEEPTTTTLSAITRDDLLTFHRRIIRPSNMIITASGDFNRAELLTLLEQISVDVGVEAVPPPAIVIPSPYPDKRTIFHIPRKTGLSVIRIGQLSISKDDPDLHALKVLNTILGNGLTSRLVIEIRTNHGLAYSVRSSLNEGQGYQGSFTVATEVKAETTAKVIRLILAILERIRTEPVSAAELETAKQTLINSFMFGFQSPDSTVTSRAQMEFYHYPKNYLEDYRQKISAITNADILRVAKKHLRPETMHLVVIGDANRFDQPLSRFGKVVTLK